ncbi:MAG: class I SAM-dependent RNA methyltransferase [Methylophilaceae bacterium]|jgi:putative N6-adenine-specific DNA methylase|uniref:THUMP domain-containing class I SAM-dependent RNA methyltransferase n=1 Tax=Methylobacillus sp. MM3 TaxID=1848039 RepID=UPI0007DECFD1|nr:THUMP domain-containing protein [Methylobacillus sp. MM3]OAJ71744.1 DNA methylase [Methylobacillus sp. MM3]
MKNAKQQFFATCPRGLEALLTAELTALGAQSLAPTDGGVGFSGDMPLCYRANLESRVATRIMWQVGHGRYGGEEDVYKAAYALQWPEWFAINRTFMVKVTAVKCPLKSLEFVTLRIKDAVCDKFRLKGGNRPYIDTKQPDVRVHAYLTADEYRLYLDTSGNALFQRGQRRSSVEAPLRENLAAGIIKLSGWQPGTPLFDPMCGSGTFLLEAAMIALDMAPGLNRSFGFEKLLNFDATAWQKMKQEAQGRAKPVEFQNIYGSDLDMKSVRAAKQNLDQAGLLEAVKLDRADIVDVEAPADHGVLIANPPYGVRIGEDEELAALYPKMGETLKRHFAGWNAYFLTSDLRLPKLMRLSPSKRTPLFNGPLECRLFEIKMVAGSNRKEKPAND